MAEPNANNDDDLILGVITPLRFMQVSSMLPAATLLTWMAGVEWVALSLGFASCTLFVILVARGHLEKRPLPWQVYALLVGQLGVTGWIIAQWRGLI